MLKFEGGTMATYYMLFKGGRNNITDTQWFVNRFVDSLYREADLKWIAERWIEFEDDRSMGVHSEDGEPFSFISKHRQHIPDDWIEATPDNLLGEL